MIDDVTVSFWEALEKNLLVVRRSSRSQNMISWPST